MIDLIILALLSGFVMLTALLLYPQPIRWSDEANGGGPAKRTVPSMHGQGGRAPNVNLSMSLADSDTPATRGPR